MSEKVTSFSAAGKSLNVFSAPAENPEIYRETSKDELRFCNTLPPEVKTVAVLTPASYPGGDNYQRSIDLLRKAGYKVKVMPNTFAKPQDGSVNAEYNAALLELRLQDFYAAWNDPEVDMIIPARGGRGCDELVRNLDWSKLKKRPELRLQGYSDITLLLCAMLKYNNGHPVAGPNVGSLVGLQPRSISEMSDCHCNRPIGPMELIPLVPGDCKGLPLAGLARRLEVAAEAPYSLNTAGRIFFIESVKQSIAGYRESLKHLIQSGFFRGAAGVVFCHYIRVYSRNQNPGSSDAGENQEEALALYKELAPEFGVPVYCGFPFGHSPENFTIDFQRPAEIKNHKLYFPPVTK